MNFFLINSWSEGVDLDEEARDELHHPDLDCLHIQQFQFGYFMCIIIQVLNNKCCNGNPLHHHYCKMRYFALALHKLFTK